MEHSPQCAHGLTAVTCASCKYGPAEAVTGYFPEPSDDDRAFDARKHETVTRRSNSGRTSQRVTRFGAAYVMGAIDIDVNGLPLLAEFGPDVNVIHPSTAAARMVAAALDDGRIRRGRHGRLSVIDLEKITAAAYGDLLPPMLNGTEVRQYQQQIHRDRAAAAATTTQTCDITGGRTVEISTLYVTDAMDAQGVHTPRVVRDDTIGDIYAQNDAHGPQTDTEVRWPTRGTADGWKYGRVPYGQRTDDPRTRREMYWDSRPMVHTPYGRMSWRVVVVNGHTGTVGLPTVTVAPVPPTEARMDWKRVTCTPIVGLSYGKRGAMRQWHWTLPVTAVTHHDGTAVTDVTVAAPVPTTVDRIHDGHTVLERSPAIVRTTTALADRTTVEADERPTTVDAWEALITRLTPGKRATIADVTVTFAKRGDRYSATSPGIARVQTRTARAMAERLAAA